MDGLTVFLISFQVLLLILSKHFLWALHQIDLDTENLRNDPADIPCQRLLGFRINISVSSSFAQRWDIVFGAVFTYFSHLFPALGARPLANANIQCISPSVLHRSLLIVGRIRGCMSTYSIFSEPNSTVHYRMLGASGPRKYLHAPTMAAHSNQKVKWVERRRGRETLSSAISFNSPVVFPAPGPNPKSPTGSGQNWLAVSLSPLSFFFRVKTFPWVL